jgi:hypothetical protein
MPILTRTFRLKIAGLALLLIPIGALCGWNSYTGWFRGYQAHRTFANAGPFFYTGVVFNTVLFFGVSVTIFLFFYAAVFGHAPHFLKRLIPANPSGVANSNPSISSNVPIPWKYSARADIEERAYPANRRELYLLIIALSAFSTLFALIVVIVGYEIIADGDIHGIFGSLLLTIFLVILLSQLEPLLLFNRTQGQALTTSERGVQYHILSDELVPWSKIKDAAPFSYRGKIVGVKLKLSRDFSKTMRWRGTIANLYRPRNMKILFRFIDAPKAKVTEALLRNPIADRP